MQIDWPIAYDATAGQRHGRFLAPPEQWSDHANRSAHAPNHLVWRNGTDVLRGDGNGSARPFHMRAEVRQDLEHIVRVAQVRYTPDRDRFASQQGCRQNRQSRVLRTADLDRTRKRVTAVY